MFSSFSDAGAGVCIVFNNNFEFEIFKTFSDTEGRFIIKNIKTGNKILTLLKIYARNDDSAASFENILCQLFLFECFSGAFNMVMNAQKGKKSGNPVTHTNLSKVL